MAEKAMDTYGSFCPARDDSKNEEDSTTAALCYSDVSDTTESTPPTATKRVLNIRVILGTCNKIDQRVGELIHEVPRTIQLKFFQTKKHAIDSLVSYLGIGLGYFFHLALVELLLAPFVLAYLCVAHALILLLYLAVFWDCFLGRSIACQSFYRWVVPFLVLSAGYLVLWPVVAAVTTTMDFVYYLVCCKDHLRACYRVSKMKETLAASHRGAIPTMTWLETIRQNAAATLEKEEKIFQDKLMFLSDYHTLGTLAAIECFVGCLGVRMGYPFHMLLVEAPLFPFLLVFFILRDAAGCTLFLGLYWSMHLVGNSGPFTMVPWILLSGVYVVFIPPVSVGLGLRSCFRYLLRHAKHLWCLFKLTSFCLPKAEPTISKPCEERQQENDERLPSE